ncbi:2-thiouracil desulfurase family protein, partial [Ralstonia pseudosolanacearum]|uniref:DUF523 domain-containing protein n=1 Tax=Ralstonia pseudosolanacearum TaxID=1310165 RepID=UPI003CF179F9
MPVHRVLVSACLLGQPVRYDGGTVIVEGGILARWQMEGRIVPMCPEMAGGKAVPITLEAPDYRIPFDKLAAA